MWTIALTYILRAWAVAVVFCARSFPTKNLIIDTDLYSDTDDAGALLLAATSPRANILAINVNVASWYSAVAASAILAHYGHSFADVPVGVRRPLTNDTFFDAWGFELGEYASKVAYHYADPEKGSLAWGRGAADDAWDAVALYRRVLADADDASVTIASIGFLENLSGLLNSTADEISPLNGQDLVATKVAELVVMGGEYPSGSEWNFWGDNPLTTAHVVHNWRGKVVFSGYEMGRIVLSGGKLIDYGPPNDPVRDAYAWYTCGRQLRPSWDPLTLLYAIDGLGDLFGYATEYGYNHVYPNGSNEWVYDRSFTDQRFLKLTVSDTEAAATLDRLYLDGARLAAGTKRSFQRQLWDATAMLFGLMKGW
ncbi:inosine/uridine-preferring nucleoside hydrolase [Xylaria grammica]|nr:inosine/uridine-preferring nucleoside hydrolase [Xylaria grammica]